MSSIDRRLLAFHEVEPQRQCTNDDVMTFVMVIQRENVTILSGGGGGGQSGLSSVVLCRQEVDAPNVFLATVVRRNYRHVSCITALYIIHRLFTTNVYILFDVMCNDCIHYGQ